MLLLNSYFPILKERQSQLVSSLSGGEQQMLATGRALMASPKLILMDEPSMGLSPLMVEEIHQIIYNISSTGVTIVLVEQDARMALRAAKYAYVLETGHVAMEGEGQRLVNNDYVKEKYLGGK